jgi:hypothetical protein
MAVAVAAAAAALAAAFSALRLFLGCFFSTSFFLGEESCVAVFADLGVHTLPVDAVLVGSEGGGSGVGVGNSFSAPELGGGGVGVASCGLDAGFRTSGFLLHGFAGAEACVAVGGLFVNSGGG